MSTSTPIRPGLARRIPQLNGNPIAYFSTEFGLHEALPMYAGGLGVLSGDHLKEASDLGLPLVAVGFLYRQGYFRQHITEDGWQEAINENLNLAESAILPVLDENKQPADRAGGDARSGGVRAPVAHPGGPRAAVPDRYRCRGQFARRSGTHHPPVLQRSGTPLAAGDHSGHRRRARAARAGLQSGSVAHE